MIFNYGGLPEKMAIFMLTIKFHRAFNTTFKSVDNFFYLENLISLNKFSHLLLFKN
jgi:hypothetical protein